MSILVNASTKVICQGIPGNNGTFYLIRHPGESRDPRFNGLQSQQLPARVDAWVQASAGMTK